MHSLWPIFREHHVRRREAVDDMSEAELEELTFAQWLEYYLSHADYEGERKFLLSDENYWLVFKYVTSGNPVAKIAAYAKAHGLDADQKARLYHSMGDNTFKYSVQKYQGELDADVDSGPVLVTFVEPKTDPRGKTTRRKASSTTPMTHGLMRTCVPYSYIERVLRSCHAGDLGGSHHVGMELTWKAVSAKYHGISRNLARMYVAKCATCQLQPKREHKAALQRQSATRLFERIVIDLIDFQKKPSGGFHYILQCVDHYSKIKVLWNRDGETSWESKNVKYFQADLVNVVKAWEQKKARRAAEQEAEAAAARTPSQSEAEDCVVQRVVQRLAPTDVRWREMGDDEEGDADDGSA